MAAEVIRRSNRGPRRADSSGATRESAPLSIAEIDVVGLFGVYDYHLSPSSAAGGSAARLLILYGDNGSGKTTLLKMVSHLLSPADDRGHRTFLARTPFRRLRIALSNGTVVEAEKEVTSGQQELTLRVTPVGGPPCQSSVPISEDGSVNQERRSVTLQEEWAGVILQLKRLGLSIYFLGDDRKAEAEIYRNTGHKVDDTGGWFRSPVQFLVATHSISLLAQNKDNVVPLHAVPEDVA